jgi:hypothetical protein
MAQIIKHRRGSLESISAATKRAGELLVVTGSTGITAANGNSILFVGIDGSTATPANKVLQGTSVPNLTGASYDTSVDGIPFYDTSANKLYILNKGGNIEVKATANTNGTGIVSGSSQVTALLPTGTVSGSSQVNADSITNFDTNVKDKLNADGVISGSSQVNADSITNFDTNVKDKLNADGVVSGSSQITISSTTGFSTFSSSISTNVVELFATASDHEGRIDTIEASIGGGGSLGTRVTNLESFTSSQETINGFYNSFTSSINTTIKNKLDAETVVSSSAQVKDLLPAGSVSGSSQVSFVGLSNIPAGIVSGSTQVKNLLPAGSVSGSTQVLGGTGIVSSSAQIDALFNIEGVVSSSAQVKELLPAGTVSGSVQVLGGTGIVSGSSQVVSLLSNQATDFGTGRVSGDNFGDAAGTSTFTGSFVGDGSALTGLVTALKISGSNGSNDSVDLLTDVLTITGSGIVTAIVTNNTLTLSAVNASTSQKGVASFDSDDFSVSTGNVSIKANGVRAANLNADVAGTGLSLDGVDNSLEVDYGSTAGTAVEGNTSLTIQGTSNEVTVSGGSITLGAGGTVTIGLPDDVTMQTGSTVGDFEVGGDLTVVGNLFVQGTTTTIDSTTIQIGDNILELNGSGAANGGLLVKDATNPNTVSGSLLWDSTNDYWKGGALGSEKQFARFNATPTSASVQVIGANGLLVDSDISDDGVAVTISTDLIISGLTANSFLVANGTKELTSVAPSNDGDLIQWNGSSFVASNTIDGGTF